MEVEERRRSGSSDKTSKKGGKRVKALTAEEEARRREIVKEKLREKLELEKRALKIVERLLEDSVAEDFLVDCAKFIVSANYKDAVEERSIAKMCGYPICSNKLGKIPTQQFRICTKTNKVYDITERKCYCSNFCYKASKEFELQISKTPLWLRQHESPPEIKLMKKGDGGSSGEEVLLSERRLQEDDIENPLAAHPDDPHSSQQGPAGGGHSESSDIEQEQDFVSSMVSQQQGPRVHWGDLPKRTDEDKKGERGKMGRRKKQRREGGEEEIEGQSQGAERGEESLSCKTEAGTDDEKRLHSFNTDKPNGEQVTEERGLPDAPSVDEAAAQLNLCTLSETVAQTAPPPVDSTSTQAESTILLTSPPCEDSNSPTESKHLLSSTLINTNQDDHDMALTNQPGLSITQVGMSKRGAAGLRDLLKKNTAETKPASIRLNLLECLRRTLKDWSTDETLKFLYGADHSLGSPYADVKKDKEVEVKEEELDEDDLEDEVTEEDAEGVDAEVQKRPSAAAPDYRTLRTETQQLELRVKEFYKGTWIVPEEVEEPHGDKVTVQDQSTKDPALPLVDSHAQHLIQKRITVEKLTSCLKNIVGPLCLAMTDISTDLNNLVRTFRFTNTNIIHKTPEWTLIAVVLLHLLAEVSPVVREALETRASVEYLNTLMEELGLQEQDLLNLVQLFKTPTH
ncbi:putative RNA polymerase II subunit B1 CTD phosphatase rpap2 isoform X1 [Epinephelus fuscoguttatus]|uniref:putative RNA polymerase II subunit B1 CTD phosphatase rpap2 isoform X1 n=2 Tax=Epinephelus fuscoguttatus TaxID=293821 RepID=UPI0020D1D7FC|nr:putative RNA polymerase II subunit B1 CTD phosphatase rpap2 isoform X1 [Epinephelus fuscoguttatus]